MKEKCGNCHELIIDPKILAGREPKSEPMPVTWIAINREPAGCYAATNACPNRESLGKYINNPEYRIVRIPAEQGEPAITKELLDDIDFCWLNHREARNQYEFDHYRRVRAFLEAMKGVDL